MIKETPDGSRGLQFKGYGVVPSSGFTPDAGGFNSPVLH